VRPAALTSARPIDTGTQNKKGFSIRPVLLNFKGRHAISTYQISDEKFNYSKIAIDELRKK